MTAFLKENAKHVALNKSVLFHLRSHIKNSCFVSQCGNNSELALQYGGFCTMRSFHAKDLLLAEGELNIGDYYMARQIRAF